MKMKKGKAMLLRSLVFTILFLIGNFGVSRAHFGMIIPSDDIITKADNKNITLKVMFIHPMEGDYMNMEKPTQFGVMVMGKKQNLLNTLKENKRPP
ncbi:MAG: DUF4198 domain-containing protein, partial [Elusimicrobiota bacterium]|nr:DUF4198 domain-containing protein [Elusimicrobiota bacterium]